ncbi:hypothetical protein CCHR01_13433 [Colletotrichum chrysophilum]|uniref:Uncharacterized protein n=1 Tax=Colletotrichum chrysophilum TaxID=1836956 RepID=A0AAD9AA72_9PEZI|nr:hypothetical protein CCHR01_13433 [Colletotrichum chrysophilum]
MLSFRGARDPGLHFHSVSQLPLSCWLRCGVGSDRANGSAGILAEAGIRTDTPNWNVDLSSPHVLEGATWSVLIAAHWWWLRPSGRPPRPTATGPIPSPVTRRIYFQERRGGFHECSSAVPSSHLLENSSVFSLGPGLGQFPYSRRS